MALCHIPDAVWARAAVLVTELVEPARVTTLEKLDEGRQAFDDRYGLVALEGITASVVRAC